MLPAFNTNYRVPDDLRRPVARHAAAHAFIPSNATEFNAWQQSTYKLVTFNDMAGLSFRIGASAVMQVATQTAIMPLVELAVGAALGAGTAGALPLLLTSAGVALGTTVLMTGAQNVWAAINGGKTPFVSDLGTGLLFSLPATMMGVWLTQAFAAKAGLIGKILFDLGTEIPQGFMSAGIREGIESYKGQQEGSTTFWQHVLMETVDGGINNILGMGAEKATHGVKNVTTRVLDTAPKLTRSATLFAASAGPAFAAGAATGDSFHFLTYSALAGAVLMCQPWDDYTINRALRKLNGQVFSARPGDPFDFEGFNQLWRMIEDLHNESTTCSNAIKKFYNQLKKIRDTIDNRLQNKPKTVEPAHTQPTIQGLEQEIHDIRSKLNKFGKKNLNNILNLPERDLSAKDKEFLIKVFSEHIAKFEAPGRFLQKYYSACRAPHQNGFHFELTVIDALKDHPFIKRVYCSARKHGREFDLILGLEPPAKHPIYVEVKIRVTPKTIAEFKEQISSQKEISKRDEADLIIITAPSVKNPDDTVTPSIPEEAVNFLKEKGVPYFDLPTFLAMKREELEAAIRV